MKNPKLHVHEPVSTFLSVDELDLYDCFLHDGELYIVVDKDMDGTVKVFCLTNRAEKWMGGSLTVRPVTMTYVEVTPV